MPSKVEPSPPPPRSRGSEHYNPRTNHLLLHSVPESEIKSRNNKAKAFGTGR